MSLSVSKISMAILVATMAILIAGFWCFADASTYYVRTDGNDNCNGTVDSSGSSGNCAFRTILKGLQTAQAGDTVIVHSGSYTGETLSSQRAGTSGNLITLQAYPGETVSISRITISHNYNVVQGLRVTGSGAYSGAGITISGSYDQALYNTILGTCNTCTGGEGACCGAYITGSNNILSHNTFDGVNNGASTAFGQAIYTATSSSNDQITFNLIQNVNTPGRLFEIYGSGHTISHNEVKGTSNAGCSSQVHVDLFQSFASASSNILVEDNYFHDLDSQWVMLADDPADGGSQGIINHWTFRNNIFANITQAGFIKSEYIAFYNNTFSNVGPGAGYNFLCYSTDSEGWGDHGSFENNVVITNANQGICNDATTIAYNYYGTPSYGTYNAPGGTNYVSGGNPQFTAAYSNCMTNTCSFNIGATSVLIGKGTDLSSLFITDYAGNTRSLPWDIGAYEYVSSTGTERPSAPSLSLVN